MRALLLKTKLFLARAGFFVLLIHLLPFCIKFLYHPAVILFILLNHLYSREARAGRGNGTGGKIFSANFIIVVVVGIAPCMHAIVL